MQAWEWGQLAVYSKELSECGISADDFSEDLLSAHESELDRIRGFYADNKEVFRLVEKRESLWDKMQEFEVSWFGRATVKAMFTGVCTSMLCVKV